MGCAAVNNPFPLPLNAFEHYMLADDRPRYPMAFYFRLTFRGRLDRRHFESAWQRTLARHPLLRARVDGPESGTTGQYRWLDAGSDLPFIDWGPAETPTTFPGEPHIDLRSHAGLRLWVREGAGEARVLIQWHHSCCDAIGATHVLDEWLREYDALASPAANPPPPETGEGHALHDRGRLGVGWGEYLARLPHDASRIFKFFRYSPSPLAMRAAPGVAAGQVPTPLLPSHAFTPEDVTRGLAAARSARATLNDLLLRDLFVAADAWNRRHAPREPRGWLRVAMPTNMRVPPDRRTSACNLVSMVYLTRHASRADDPAALLSEFAGETRHVKRWRLGATLLSVLGVAGAIPGAMRTFLNERCRASTGISNLGVVFERSPLRGLDGFLRAGAARLEHIEFVPPFRPLTRAMLGALTYNGRLVVALNHDPNSLDDADARQLLGIFVERLTGSFG
jgi:hypothetical protein